MSKTIEDMNAMSDEDFLNIAPEDYAEEAPADEDQDEAEETFEDEEQEQESDDSDEEDTDTDEDADEEEEDESEESVEDDEDEDSEEESGTLDEEEDADEDDSEDSEAENIDTEEKDTSNSSEMNYKETCDKIFAPFTANGVEWQVKSPDEVIRLMEMGANYHKKMAGLKPSLKTVRLLQNHGLLDPEKINYLIDLHAKKPEAITKLIKDSGMDVLDVDTTKDSDYTPEVRTVSDTEYDLQEVMDSIKDTPTYTRTLNVVTEWDEASSDAVANAPQSLRLLNQQVADGTFDIIKTEIDRLKAFGQVPAGTTDFQAYQQVGTYLAQQGKLGQPGRPTPEVAKETTVSKTKKSIKKRKVSREGAAIPSGKGKKSSPPKIDPLDLSDEEFEKFNFK